MAERRGPSVYTIAAHRGFADALVAGLLPRYREPDLGLARLTLLLPSRRTVRTVTEAFVRLSGQQGSSRGLLLLVPHVRAVNYRGQGDFHLDQEGRVTRRKPDRVAPFIFSGIQLASHRVLRDAPDGPFSTNVLWQRAIEEQRLFGISHNGVWFEVGDPQSIAPTEAYLSRG